MTASQGRDADHARTTSALSTSGSANPTAHWAYLIGVLVGGLVLMIALIALLGGSA